jgi:hypothetical protein
MFMFLVLYDQKVLRNTKHNVVGVAKQRLHAPKMYSTQSLAGNISIEKSHCTALALSKPFRAKVPRLPKPKLLLRKLFKLMALTKDEVQRVWPARTRFLNGNLL